MSRSLVIEPFLTAASASLRNGQEQRTHVRREKCEQKQVTWGTGGGPDSSHYLYQPQYNVGDTDIVNTIKTTLESHF